MPERATPSQRRELGAVARYCVDRVERELGAPEGWFVRVGPIENRFVCTIVVHDSGCAIEATCDEVDGALAIWDTVREIERVLRDVRACRACRRISLRRSA
jgi:hypothetical protein